jgi:hypothetical protein
VTASIKLAIKVIGSIVEQSGIDDRHTAQSIRPRNLHGGNRAVDNMEVDRDTIAVDIHQLGGDGLRAPLPGCNPNRVYSTIPSRSRNRNRDGMHYREAARWASVRAQMRSAVVSKNNYFPNPMHSQRCVRNCLNRSS